MWDLRWVLLGLGALVLVGVYLWSRGIVSRDMLPALPRRKQRTEPSIGEPLPTDAACARAAVARRDGVRGREGAAGAGPHRRAAA